ncbi:MAG: T9SS type A sorting domain-containing protein [Bacteroidetes bacterium]|nr:T9SS type A sorting domain-containing protein [Bacteroidota bacterium]
MKKEYATMVLAALLLLLMGSSVVAQISGPRFRADDDRYVRSTFARSANDAAAMNVLPAEWTGLAGVRSADGTLLRWSTSSEHSSAWFKIECRKEGDNPWQVVDILPAAGESSTPRFYSWVHANPPPGTVEYRLRQIDTYGKESSTGELRVETVSAKRFSLSPCYPNPANGETLVALNTGMEVVGSLVIVDLIGRIRQIVFQNQELLQGSYRFRIGTATLPPGKYLLRLTTSEGVSTQRLIIAR